MDSASTSSSEEDENNAAAAAAVPVQEDTTENESPPSSPPVASSLPFFPSTPAGSPLPYHSPMSLSPVSVRDASPPLQSPLSQSPPPPQPLSEEETASPAPTKRSRTRGGTRGRGAGRARGIRVRGGANCRGGQSTKRKTQSQSTNKKNNNVEFHWNDKKRSYREFPFTANPGVKVHLLDRSCPLSILKTFLTDKLMDDIVSHTNRYAELIKSLPQVQERMEATQRSLFTLWKDLTVDELWVYISIQVLMGIVHKPNIHLYWSGNHLVNTPIFSRLMRRDRFEQIRKMLHFTNPLSEDPQDSLSKLNTFLDSLRETFRANYKPEKHLAVDEYLSLWKGRLKFRMYIPSKRERYGIKIYMLCESDTGYLVDFIIYTGADTKYPKPTVPLPKNFDDYKNPSKVVLSLMEGYYNYGHNLALDNFYTSPELLKALFLNHTDAYGTLRKKEGLPSDFWSWKPAKGVGEPAEIKFCDETYMVLRWNDPYKTKKVKIVSMMSTKHVGDIVDAGKLHHATKQQIRKPDVIVQYNKTMGGVDNLSRVLVPYALARKGVKWYRKLAELFIDFCIYNSFIMWKKLNPNVRLTNLQFRDQLVKSIIMFHVQDEASNRSGPSEADTSNQNPLRLKEKHFIGMIPLLPNQNKRKRKRCVRCTAMGKRTDSSYECKKCGVGLCLEPCFEIYHTKKHYDRDYFPIPSSTEEELTESESESEESN